MFVLFSTLGFAGPNEIDPPACFVSLSLSKYHVCVFVQAKYQELLPDVSHWQPSPLLLRLAEAGDSLSGYYAKKAVTSRL